MNKIYVHNVNKKIAKIARIILNNVKMYAMKVVQLVLIHKTSANVYPGSTLSIIMNK